MTTRDGEREARFRALFDAHYDRVYAYAARRAGATIGEDVAANVLTLAWQKLDGIPAERELAWLLTSVRHILSTTARGDVRRRTRERAVLSPSVPDFAGNVAERAAIAHALDSLGATDRDLLLLCLWDDVSPTDASRILNLTVGTVRVRLHRARNRFRTESSRCRRHRPLVSTVPRRLGGTAKSGGPHHQTVRPVLAVLSESGHGARLLLQLHRSEDD